MTVAARNCATYCTSVMSHNFHQALLRGIIITFIHIKKAEIFHNDQETKGCVIKSALLQGIQACLRFSEETLWLKNICMFLKNNTLI